MKSQPIQQGNTHYLDLGYETKAQSFTHRTVQTMIIGTDMSFEKTKDLGFKFEEMKNWENHRCEDGRSEE